MSAAEEGLTPALITWALDQRYNYLRILPDGLLVGVGRLVGGQAYVWRGRPAEQTDVWTYPTLGDALTAAVDWSGRGEPAHRAQ